MTPVDPVYSEQDVTAANDAAEAARQKTWTEVLAERRATASLPRPEPAPLPGAPAAPVAPAGPSHDEVQAMIRTEVAQGLEDLGNKLLTQLGAPPARGSESNPAGS